MSIFVRRIDDPYSDIHNLSDGEQRILRPILEIIDRNNLKEKVFFFNIKSQKELAASYKYFAGLGSVFALTALYEPFGLAPIEAAACGLSIVATKNGGPSEVFKDGSGILVDPLDDKDISEGLLKGIKEYRHFSPLGIQRVKAKYTWKNTAEAYLEVIQQCVKKQYVRDLIIPELNASERIRKYLTESRFK